MTFLGSIDIPTRTVDDFREALRVREAELVAAKQRRDDLLTDIQKVNSAIDSGNKPARNALPGLTSRILGLGG
jgi:hypothetical protein